MNKRIIISILFSLIITPAIAKNKNTKAITHTMEIYSQFLSLQISLNWKLVYKNHGNKEFLIQFIPKDEKLSDWTELLSISASKGVSKTIDIKKMSKNNILNFKKICPKNMVYREFGETKISGYQANNSFMGCASTPNSNKSSNPKGQSVLHNNIIIRGKEDIYTISKIVRGKGFNINNPPKDIDQIISSMNQFYPIKLIDPKPKAK